MKNLYLEIKINKQKYLYNIIKDYPLVTSGRKNYTYQYKRVLKNIYLTKEFKKRGINNFFKYKYKFYFK